jgi:hypothetical protein
VPMDLTSIDTDEYHAGLNGGPRGDDSEDLGTTDLFGAFGAVDGDDGVRMATPSSTTSTVMPTATPIATLIAMVTATLMPPQEPRKRTSNRGPPGHKHRGITTRPARKLHMLGMTSRSSSTSSMVRGQDTEPNATTARKC